MRPCTIVDDRAFQSLMKTGRPTIRIPSSQTVARDVHFVFERVKARVAKMLKVCLLVDGVYFCHSCAGCRTMMGSSVSPQTHGLHPTVNPTSPSLYTSSTKASPFACFSTLLRLQKRTLASISPLRSPRFWLTTRSRKRYGNLVYCSGNCAYLNLIYCSFYLLYATTPARTTR